jgi:hypothetical protein
MKSTDFSHRTHYDFCRLLQEAPKSGGQRMSETLRDFLELAYLAFQQPVNVIRYGKKDEEIEKDYMRLVDRYHANKMAEALAALACGLEDHAHDFIGGCLASLGMLDKDFAGQVFTPDSLCELLAAMTLGDVDPDPNHRLTLAEPCIGGGAIVIAAFKHLKKRGFGPKDFFVVGQDVATMCHRAAYVQLTLLYIPATVTRGDSLRGPEPENETVLTLAGAVYPYRPEQEQRVIHCRERRRINKAAA